MKAVKMDALNKLHNYEVKKAKAKLASFILSFILTGAGLILLIYATDWKVGLALFFWTWGNNMMMSEK